MRRIAVIMAGGSGERFWPASRADKPKQLLAFPGSDRTLLEQAVKRCEAAFDADSIVIAATPSVRSAIIEAGVAPESRIISEPAKRNTLGAIVWATAWLLSRGEDDSQVAFLAADHWIGDTEAFCGDVRLALAEAERTQDLVTIGLQPSRAETGYGYIRAEPQSEGDASSRVAAFEEKPTREVAESYLAAGDRLWNSGMFFWTLAAFQRELGKACPEAFAALHNVARALARNDLDLAREEFLKTPDTSVDYALMERSSRVRVVRASFDWDDLGSWDSLKRIPAARTGSNVLLGDVEVIDCDGCVLVNRSSGMIAAAIGIQDVVIAVTDDAVLVCPQDQAQRVKEIVARLRARGDRRV